jgi:hypothetical protein
MSGHSTDLWSWVPAGLDARHDHAGWLPAVSFCSASTQSWQWTKREPSAWGYNWTTLFLGDIRLGTWPTGLGESRIWESRIWDSNPRMTALARTSSNCKRQIRSLVTETAQLQQPRNCVTVIKIRSHAPDGYLTPRQTHRLTIGHKIILSLTLIRDSIVLGRRQPRIVRGRQEDFIVSVLRPVARKRPVKTLNVQRRTVNSGNSDSAVLIVIQRGLVLSGLWCEHCDN